MSFRKNINRKLSFADCPSSSSNILDYNELVRIVPVDTPNQSSKAIFHPAANIDETLSSISFNSFNCGPKISKFGIVKENDEINANISNQYQVDDKRK